MIIMIQLLSECLLISVSRDSAVQLYDSQFALVQTAKVDFKVNSTCFCFGTCGCTVRPILAI